MPIVRIRTTEGTEEVEAELFGALALHVGVNGFRLWNLTHVPTGKFIVKDLGKQTALGLAERLRKLDWEGYELARKQEFQAAVRAAAGPEADLGRTPEGGRSIPASGFHYPGSVPVPGHG